MDRVWILINLRVRRSQSSVVGPQWASNGLPALGAARTFWRSRVLMSFIEGRCSTRLPRLTSTSSTQLHKLGQHAILRTPYRAGQPQQASLPG